MFSKQSFTALFALFLCVQVNEGSAAIEVSPTSFAMPATFTIDGRSLATTSSFVVMTDEFFVGQTRALKILYLPKEITNEAISDILKNSARSITNDTEHAYVVLFLDKSNKIWQVNITIVLKGMTVGYTVASEPDQLQRFASLLSFDGDYLRLRSKGAFQGEIFGKSSAISWDVNDDLPVYDVTSKNGQ